jgi:uncharacterized protein (UPF0548 family)
LNGLRWEHDRHEHPITAVADKALFDRAADRVMRYDFYPPAVMHHVSDASLEDRWLREGDLIVQRIHGLNGLLDGVTATRVSEIIAEPRRAGFAYVTTEAHFEIGEWWCWVEWKPARELTVNILAFSRPGPRLPVWAHGNARRAQLRAHHAGPAHFAARVTGG